MRQLAMSLAAIFALSMGTSAQAEEFQTVTDRDDFLNVLTGKKLVRFGIELDVSPSGQISGSAFGVDVSGAWRWEGNYFCRDLYYGSRDLGPNCQEVKIRGDVVRFTSDEGNGEYADLRLR